MRILLSDFMKECIALGTEISVYIFHEYGAFNDGKSKLVYEGLRGCEPDNIMGDYYNKMTLFYVSPEEGNLIIMGRVI